MAKPKSLGRRFVKGVSGNPLGAKIHNKELKELRRLTAEEFVDLGTVLLDATILDIKEIVSNPKSKSLRVWVSTIIMNGIKKGDARSLNEILDRLIGKQKTEVELSGNKANPIMIQHSTLTEEQIDEKIRLLLEETNQD